MPRWVKRIAIVKLIVVATIGIAFVVGMRKKSPRVLRAVRSMNRAVFNPIQMGTAGTPGAYAAIVRHVGRTSGNRYETPVGAVPTDDGFLIALPYGTDADWLKNVVAAGTATIVHEGETHEVDRPRVVAMAEVADSFSDGDRRAHRVFGVQEALCVRRASAAGSTLTQG